MSTMVERVARAMAKQNGDDYDHVPLDKADWTAQRGMFGGRFRDLNELMQVDYDEMARAAIEALMEPCDEMIQAGVSEDQTDEVYRDVRSVYTAMIQEALKEQA
jgi:hypothetical protein